MKVLVTGANGLLGQELVSKLSGKNHEVIGTGKGPSRLTIATGARFNYFDIDITIGEKINNVIIKTKPSVIIHTAAMTQVDECENKKVVCWNTNVTATRFIIDAAKEIKSKIIFISSDFVFDGKKGPYKEDDTPDPVNYYGSTKLAAEKAVIESGLEWAIIRTVLVLGQTLKGQRQTIIGWVKENLENKKTIKVVDDQVRTPTFVEDLAAGIILVLEKKASGIFHISGKDFLTPYQVAILTARHFKLNSDLVEKVNADTFSQPAVRPLRTGFIIEKAEKELGFKPHSFTEMMEKYF